MLVHCLPEGLVCECRYVEGMSLREAFTQMQDMLGENLTKERLWAAKKLIVQQVLLVSRLRMQSSSKLHVASIYIAVPCWVYHHLVWLQAVPLDQSWYMLSSALPVSQLHFPQSCCIPGL